MSTHQGKCNKEWRFGSSEYSSLSSHSETIKIHQCKNSLLIYCRAHPSVDFQACAILKNAIPILGPIRSLTNTEYFFHHFSCGVWHIRDLCGLETLGAVYRIGRWVKGGFCTFTNNSLFILPRGVIQINLYVSGCVSQAMAGSQYALYIPTLTLFRTCFPNPDISHWYIVPWCL